MPLTNGGPRLRACPFRPDCPGASAARSMIMWIPHQMSCGIHMIMKITQGRLAVLPPLRHQDGPTQTDMTQGMDEPIHVQLA